jgi:hypothetical protein
MLIHCVFVVESTKKQIESKKQRKKHEKNEKRKTKDNLIFSLVNLTFLLIGPYAFTHSLYLLKKYFLMWRRVQFKGPICFKLVPGILDPGPLSKVTLNINQIANH